MLLELKNVKKTYPQGTKKIEVLHGIDLQISEGEFISIMGKSGSGKSTFINVIGLLDQDFEGDYDFEGQAVKYLDDGARATFRNEKIGFVFQQFHLIDEYTVKENILLPFLYANQAEDWDYIHKLLIQFDLADKVNVYPYELSGGQKQRVAIIRALVNRPQLIIADEPTGALDENNRNEILKVLQGLNQSGVALLLVTHDPEVAALADRQLMMRDGYLEEK